MLRYTLRRLLVAIPTLLLVTGIVFVVMRLLPPGFTEASCAGELGSSGAGASPRTRGCEPPAAPN